MVKDEEKNLERCLDSLVLLREKIEAELIIIDTGSSDRSPSIAKRYTDKVYFHKWNNNFSEMRNISIRYAIGEWILIIDADEELKSCEEIIEFLSSTENKSYNSATILCKNVMGDFEYNTIFLITYRLFRNNGRFYYKGAVHNIPVFDLPTKNLKDTLYHYGYITTDKELIDKKFNRTAALLLEELKKEPNNVYYRYQLSVSYFMHQDFKEALEECERVYKYIKDNGLDLRRNLYVYAHLVKCLIMAKNFERAKLICEEGIKLEDEHLDLYCYLGEILLELNKPEEAIKAFNKYLNLVSDYNNLSIAKDTMVYTEKLQYFEKVYYYLASIYFNKKSYSEAIKYSHLIKSKELINDSIPIFLESFVRLEKYLELKKYYDYVISCDESISSYLCDNLEKTVEKMKYNDLFDYYRALSEGNDKYTILNKLRLAIVDNKEIERGIIYSYLSSVDFNNSPNYYGDVLYYCIYYGIDFYSYLINATEANLVKYFLYLDKKSSDFVNVLMKFSKSYANEDGFKYVRVNKIIFKVLMAAGGYEDNVYWEIFSKYAELGIKYIASIYNNELIDNELIADVKNNEEAFLLYLKKGFELKGANKIGFVKFLKKCLNIYPEMKKGIEILLEKEFNEDINNKSIEENKEFELYKIEIKNSIKAFTENNQLEEAIKLISEYEQVVKKDFQIYSMKAVIAIMQNKLSEAEEILKEGLKINSSDFDLQYNLAYVYEKVGKIDLSLYYYEKSLLNSREDYIARDIKENIKRLRSSLLERANMYIKKKEYLNALEGYEKLICSSEDIEFISGIANKINTLEQNYKDNIIKQQKKANDNKIQKQRNIIKSIIDYDYLHIMIDSPYSKKFIQIINKNFDCNKHYFVIVYNNKLNYLDVLEYPNLCTIDLNVGEYLITSRVMDFINSSSKVYVHFLTDYMCRFLSQYTIEKEINWVLWGGDLYNFIDINLYDKQTLSFMHNKFGWEKKDIKNNLNYILRKTAIRKFSNIYTEFHDDFLPIKENFITAAVHGKLVYPNPVDFVSLDNSDEGVTKLYNFKSKYKYVIQVGNSGDSTNNHLEIFEQLSKMNTEDFCIIAPLSYGESKYINEIILEGKKLLGEKFIPLKEFLKPEEYFEILKQVDVSIMNHNRQQASSNMTILLYLGKKLYTKENISTAREFKRLGAKLYNVSDLENVDIDQLVQMNDEDREKNRRIIFEYFSDEKVLNHIKAIFENSLYNPKKMQYGKEGEIITFEYAKDNVEEFIPYTYKYSDDYNFNKCKIAIGKREIINSDVEMVEGILQNDENQKLILSGIWSVSKDNRLLVPDYISKSKNSSLIYKKINEIMQINAVYERNIAGFIFDENIKEDIQKNALAYNWERGIPATQFMPLWGYLNIISRYRIAGENLKKSDYVLEAASGFGYGAAYFSKLCRHVEALDIGKENIEFSSSTYKLDNVNYVLGDVTDLPYNNESFNVYVSFETIEHLPLEIIDKYMQEAMRVIKKDGKMIVSTPNRMVRLNVNNPFHIKEYDFNEFDYILKQYFKNIDYCCVINGKPISKLSENAYNMIGICEKSS